MEQKCKQCNLSGWCIETKAYSDDCCEYSIRRAKLTISSLLFCNFGKAVLLLCLTSYIIWMTDAVYSKQLLAPQRVLAHLAFIGAAIVGLRILQAHHVYRESVLVVRTYGVQVTREYSMGSKFHQFFPAHQIHSIVINEGISMHQIFYYLAIVIQKEKKLTKLCPLFLSSRPRLAVLQLLYTAMNDTMVYPRPS
ncbi:phosphatidylinositol N-acetylglucosaminyltransferase subunit H-like [Watersipora subatra]|uniref:phosphatidylinositol N-acetylglucosaminyltransferase subunit H-like n=1 Tax=Watersipora subatra TaxID=2589382 RepID=UPI00355BB934